MLNVTQRGRVYRLEGKVLGAYLRLTLGTRDGREAEKLKNLVQAAAREGNDSAGWAELRRLLPESAFTRLAKIVGYIEKAAPPPPPTWTDLVRLFSAEAQQRIAIGNLRATTWTRYQQTFKTFGVFLSEQGNQDLAQITRPVVESFKVWRLGKIRDKKFSRGGRGLTLDVAILHGIFAYAVRDCELVVKNPVRLEGRPGDDQEHGAQPFNAEQLGRMRQAASQDLLAFLLLRHTGFRGSDAVGLRWEEIEWHAHEIHRLTQKRRKRVVVPIHGELMFALETERDRRRPLPEDRVLLNPATGKPLTRPRLYERMLALGKRAEVSKAHPHRFRDTFAVDLLLKGASPYDVAKLLGDTIDTIEKHYAPFVRELRERARRIVESNDGLESCTVFAHPVINDKRPN
jgi:integrase/recombinase XerD